MITGEVPNGVYSRGKNKGSPRFDSTSRKSRTRVVVTKAEMIKAAEKYEAETGNCWNCKGGGEVVCGWSAEGGKKTRQDKKCNGTGKA